MDDIVVVTSLGLEDQRTLAKRYLMPHALRAEVISESDSGRGAMHFVSAFELVDLTIRSTPAFSALMVGFSLSFGLTLGKLFGKVFETGAGELGKDLYHWFKEMVTGAIRQSKDRNLGKRRLEPKPAIRFMLNTVLYEGSPTPVELRIHISHKFGRRQEDTQTYVDNGAPDEVVLGRVRELAAVILPLTSKLLEEGRRARKDLSDMVVIQTFLDPDEPDSTRWAIGLMGDLTLLIGNDWRLDFSFNPYERDEATIRRVYRRILRQAERAGVEARLSP